ncbi:hypothetical protein JVT61DRAFT_5273 [Boletus reticuloceps]|uniref:Armadillo-like helical domain-containing protein n=1 Tax=Boletus reticuloceps TaxID=495285 RepID=A0A8I2Z1C3_9AGAM|nr:hypothetical protein JVT61DRAFT_5273 [Boletus reticuloceps]
MLFVTCVSFAANSEEDVIIRLQAVETLSVVLRCILAKNLAGWEVMVVFADDINESDKVFMEFVDMIAQILEDDKVPATMRHRVLQLAIVYTSSVNQLSPGAYLLRRDLFPALVKLVKSPETERYTFEATLLLSFLANFHRSDAAKLNPYLQHIRDTGDIALMKKICWATNFACDTAIKAYQGVSDDSNPTFAKTIGTLITSLRPDRALSSQPVDPPRELFKNQPIEASVSLLPLFEYLFFNPLFTQVFTDTAHTDNSETATSRIPPLSYTVLSLSSYLLTHGTSSASPRAMAYANLAMNTLLIMAENSRVMDVFCGQSVQLIRLCRQRLPWLPTPASTRPPVCALLDCCVLWLRHNLHKRLEIYTYTTCIRTCFRVIWYLQKVRIRIDYEWLELWKAIIAVLGFLAGKLDQLTTTGGVENLIQETLRLVDFALSRAEIFLTTPGDIHIFIYELVRSSDVIQKQTKILQTLAQPGSMDRRMSLRSESASRSLKRVLSVISYYEAEISGSGAQTAKESLRIVARLVDKDGVNATQERHEEDLRDQGEDVIGFIRYGCSDGLALMP